MLQGLIIGFCSFFAGVLAAILLFTLYQKIWQKLPVMKEEEISTKETPAKTWTAPATTSTKKPKKKTEEVPQQKKKKEPPKSWI